MMTTTTTFIDPYPQESAASITSITIENFKGIRDRVAIDLKPVTLLFGPNSAGKSTIIQALHYAWEVIGRHNLDPNFTEFGGREMDLGCFENLVYGHDLNRSISIRLDVNQFSAGLKRFSDDPYNEYYYQAENIFSPNNIFCWNFGFSAGSRPSSFEVMDFGPGSGWIEFRISWDSINKKPYVSGYEVGLDHESIVKVKTSLKENKVYISYINFFHPLLTVPSKQKMEQAFKEILNDDTKHLSDYERAYHFKDLIDEAYENPESWLDPKIFPPDEYNKFAQLVDSFKEAQNTEEYNIRETELNDILDAISKSDGISEEEKEKLSRFVQSNELPTDYIQNYIKDKHNLSSDYDLYSPFIPYEFLFFCKDKLSIASLSADFNIELNQIDALPVWDQSELLSIDIAHSDDGYAKAIWSVLTQIIVGPGQLLKDELTKLSYLGPIRSRIPRNYVPNRYVEKRNWPDGLAAWDVLHKEEEEIVKQVDFWMADRLMSGYHITRKTYKEIDMFRVGDEKPDLQAIYNAAPAKTRLFLMDQKSGVEVQPPDVGVGISQVIPVIVSALYFKKGIISIEQPELHIHPALQVSLGDLFISQIQENGPCFILETHSEHMLLRLLRRIRETHEKKLPDGMAGLSPDQLVIHYIESGPDGVKISTLEVDETGEFKAEWPNGFFEEREEELFF